MAERKPVEIKITLDKWLLV